MSEYNNKHRNDVIYEDKQDLINPWCDLWCEPWFDCNSVNENHVDESLDSSRLEELDKLDKLEEYPPNQKSVEVSEPEPETKVTSDHVNNLTPSTDNIECIHELESALAPPLPVIEYNHVYYVDNTFVDMTFPIG